MHEVPGDAGFMEARTGADCGDSGGCQLLRLPARTLDGRCHPALLQRSGETNLARVDPGG